MSACVSECLRFTFIIHCTVHFCIAVGVVFCIPQKIVVVVAAVIDFMMPTTPPPRMKSIIFVSLLVVQFRIKRRILLTD